MAGWDDPRGKLTEEELKKKALPFGAVPEARKPALTRPTEPVKKKPTYKLKPPPAKSSRTYKLKPPPAPAKEQVPAEQVPAGQVITDDEDVWGFLEWAVATKVITSPAWGYLGLKKIGGGSAIEGMRAIVGNISPVKSRWGDRLREGGEWSKLHRGEQKALLKELVEEFKERGLKKGTIERVPKGKEALFDGKTRDLGDPKQTVRYRELLAKQARELETVDVHPVRKAPGAAWDKLKQAASWAKGKFSGGAAAVGGTDAPRSSSGVRAPIPKGGADLPSHSQQLRQALSDLPEGTLSQSEIDRIVKISGRTASGQVPGQPTRWRSVTDPEIVVPDQPPPVDPSTELADAEDLDQQGRQQEFRDEQTKRSNAAQRGALTKKIGSVKTRANLEKLLNETKINGKKIPKKERDKILGAFDAGKGKPGGGMAAAKKAFGVFTRRVLPIVGATLTGLPNTIEAAERRARGEEGWLESAGSFGRGVAHDLAEGVAFGPFDLVSGASRLANWAGEGVGLPRMPYMDDVDKYDAARRRVSSRLREELGHPSAQQRDPEMRARLYPGKVAEEQLGRALADDPSRYPGTPEYRRASLEHLTNLGRTQAPSVRPEPAPAPEPAPVFETELPNLPPSLQPGIEGLNLRRGIRETRDLLHEVPFEL